MLHKILRKTTRRFKIRENFVIHVKTLRFEMESYKKRAVTSRLVTRNQGTAFIQDEDQRAASKNLPKITTRRVLAGGTRAPSRRTS